MPRSSLPTVKASDRLGSGWLWLGYLATLLIAVPWYRQTGVQDPLWLGMPMWGWVGLAGALLMAALTLYAVLQLWPDTAAEDADADAQSVTTEASDDG